MVWTSEYPEGRAGSKSGGGSTAKTGNGASGASSSSGSSGFSGSSGSSSSSGASSSSNSPGASKLGTAVITKDSGADANRGANSKNSNSKKSGSDTGFKPNVNPISGGNAKPKSKGKPPGKPGVFLLLAGVILPFSAIVFELNTHLCAKSFFDPFPTPAHVLLFALIPVSNLLVWVASRRNLTDLLGVLTLGTGMSMGVAILYSLMFLPIVPLSVVAILWCGFGLLALSPLLAVPAVWKASKYAIHLSENHKTYFDGHQLEHIGHLIILCTVVAVELPSTMTRMHIGEAAHSVKPAAAIDWLRQWGNQEVMLRACYERSGRATDILGSLYEVKNPTSVDEARAIFYKVTGKPFNSVPLPAALRATRQNQGLLSDNENEEPNVEDEFDRDPDIAGEAVSGVARGLSMNESKLSGHIDGNLCIANIMWNVTFGNTSKYDREVRSKILLPPGAVVTNAFLIVDGTEREATVMGRSLARRKYRAAVADKKDPLLVSTCGADRVLLQLFPVAPESKIGVRLHILAPLAVTAMDKAELALPTFEERNFQVEIPTNISLKSQEPLVSSVNTLRVDKFGQTKVIQGDITTPELARFGAVVVAERDSNITHIQGSFDGALIGEDIRKINYPRPTKLFAVIDGSNGMSPHIDAVLKQLKKLPRDMDVKITYVRDGLLPALEVSAGDDKALDSAVSSISKLPCAGGQDNLLDLRTALTEAANTNSSAVLWIHSAQPLPGKLGKEWELFIRQSAKPLLYDFAVAAGPNEILAGLYNCPGLVRVNRGSYVESDMHQLFETWQKASASTAVGGIQYVRKNLANLDIEKGSLKPAEMALAKLVAFDEISKIQTVHSNHRCKAARKAVAISNAYHLVTSFSSAIITEPIPVRKKHAQNIEPPKFSLINPQPTLGHLGPSPRRGPAFGFFDGARIQGKSLRADGVPGNDAFISPSNEGQYSSSVQGNTGSQSRQELDAARPVLQGATNGTISPMLGDQFSSAVSAAGAGGDNSIYNSAVSNSARYAPAQGPMAAPMAPAAALKESSVDSKFESQAEEISSYNSRERALAKADSRADFSNSKVLFAEKKQIASRDKDADEFNDDEAGGDDGVVDEIAQSTAGEASSSALSPVVPESDTYILFGVGMLILGYALQTRKKVSIKKA